MFASKFDMTPSSLDWSIEVEIADGYLTLIHEGYPDCLIEIEGRSFSVSLLTNKIARLEVISSMDWIGENDAVGGVLRKSYGQPVSRVMWLLFMVIRRKGGLKFFFCFVLILSLVNIGFPLCRLC